MRFCILLFSFVSSCRFGFEHSVMVTSLNRAVKINVTGVDSSSGGAVLLNSSRITDDVDNNTVVLSGRQPSITLDFLFSSLNTTKLKT